MTHAQTVCTRPFLPTPCEARASPYAGKGETGDEASIQVATSFCFRNSMAFLKDLGHRIRQLSGESGYPLPVLSSLLSTYMWLCSKETQQRVL